MGVISVSRECQRIDVCIPFGDKPKSCSILFHGSCRHSQGGLFVHVFIFAPVWRKSCSLTIVNFGASWFLLVELLKQSPVLKLCFSWLISMRNIFCQDPGSDSVLPERRFFHNHSILNSRDGSGLLGL